MEKRDFKKTLELLGKMLELKEELTKQFEEIEEENDEDKIDKDLQNEYEKFMIWSVGENYHELTRSESVIRWNKLHPNLPLPRSLSKELSNSHIHTIGLMIDVYPLYLEHKKSAS